MRLLTAGAALAAALLTGGVPAVALLAEDPPAAGETSADVQRENADGPPPHAAQGKPAKTGKPAHTGHGKPAHAGQGKPSHAGKHGEHGNPHGPDHAERMRSFGADMEAWGACMAGLESSTADAMPRAEKERVCSKPMPPGHLGNEHPGHKDWHKFHGGPGKDKGPGDS